MSKEAPVVKEPEAPTEETPMTVDSLRAKIDNNKELTREETDFFLKEAPDEPVEGYTKGLEEFGKEADSEEEKSEEAGSKEEKSEEKEITKDKTEEEKEDFFVKLEAALDEKDVKDADLSSFNKRERAYFHRMKREIKARQQAEVEKDQALFREQKLKAQIEHPPAPDMLEELKKRDPNDLLTNEEVVKMMEQRKEAEPKQPEAPKVDNRWMKYLQLSDKEARDTYPDDYDTVMSLTADIVDGNRDYLVQIAASIEAGENPAIKTYELIKADKEFEELLPIAETKILARKSKETPAKKEEPKVISPEEKEKEIKAKKAEDALESNKSKTKTTGNIASGGDKSEDDMSLEEYLNMSDSEFAKRPKKERDAILKKFGG